MKDVKSSLGFARFYRRFILNYTKVVAPTSELAGKNVPWKWKAKQISGFGALKEAFGTALAAFRP